MIKIYADNDFQPYVLIKHSPNIFRERDTITVTTRNCIHYWKFWYEVDTSEFFNFIQIFQDDLVLLLNRDNSAYGKMIRNILTDDVKYYMYEMTTNV